jgi:hypothetical protein
VKEQAMVGMAFVPFAIHCMQDLIADHKLLISFVLMFVCGSVLVKFYGGAPDWARAVFAFYVISSVGKFLLTAEHVKREQLVHEKNVFDAAVSVAYETNQKPR